MNEYNYIIHHQQASNPMMGIADGLSRLPVELANEFAPEDSPHMVMPILPDDWTTHTNARPLVNGYAEKEWQKFDESKLMK